MANNTVLSRATDFLHLKECAKSIGRLAPVEPKNDIELDVHVDRIVKIFEQDNLVWRDNYAPASSMVDWYVSLKPDALSQTVLDIIAYFVQLAPSVFAEHEEVYMNDMTPKIEGKIRMWLYE